MSHILDSIAGPYPYLLIAQILIVSALLLSLIWIFIQRAQQGDFETGEQSLIATAAEPPAQKETPIASLPVSEVAAAPPPEVTVPPPPPVKQETDGDAEKLSTEAEGLKDKVRYLESRLMEYEIVQEEISNLGSLRSENEKLKEELLRLNASLGAQPPAAEAIETVSSPNEVLESVSKNQIDSILDKLDKITQKG